MQHRHSLYCLPNGSVRAESRLQASVLLAQGLDAAAVKDLLHATPEEVTPLLQREAAKAAALARHFPSAIDDGVSHRHMPDCVHLLAQLVLHAARRYPPARVRRLNWSQRATSGTGDVFTVVLEAIELRPEDVRLRMHPQSTRHALVTIVQRAHSRLLDALGVSADRVLGLLPAALEDAAYEISVPLPHAARAKAPAPRREGPYFVWTLPKLNVEC